MTGDQITLFAILGVALLLFAWGRLRYDVVAVIALLAAVLTELAEGNWDADARVPLRELEQHLQCDPLPDQQDEDIETVGGLVFTLAGRVPQIGECIDHDAGFRFEVVDADPRRIHKLRIYRPEPQAPAGDGD